MASVENCQATFAAPHVSLLCAPSRAAFLTGQYNHINGTKDNYTPLPENAVTCATLLRSSGYRTGYFGKSHMGNQRARPGFSHYVSDISHGRYINCPMLFNGLQKATVGWVDDVTTTMRLSSQKEQSATIPCGCRFQITTRPANSSSAPEYAMN
jgi:hypothetical protein